MDAWHFSPILERHFGAGSYVLVTLLGLLLFSAWAVGVVFTHLPPLRRAILAALRLLVVLLLIAVMLRPERIYTELQKQSATLILLIDGSRSMQLEDTLSGDSRWDVITEALREAAPALSDLAKDLEISAYVFDSKAEPVPVADGSLGLADQATGDESAYGAAMQEVLRREDGRRLIAFILAGDGAQQTVAENSAMPQTSARQLAQLECPLFAVAVGRRQQGQQTRDVVIESMPDDLVVFVKNRLTVTGTMRISGYVNRDIPVQLVVETAPGQEQVVATETYRAAQDGQQVRYELPYLPEQPGEYKIMVRAAAQEGEVTLTNNQLPTYLTVLAGGLRVLYLQGEIRREQRFLRRALAASPDIDVTLATLHTRNRDQWPVANLDRYFEPGQFDVYILGDLDSKAFHPGDATNNRPADLLLLRQAVERGAGLLLLGGWHTYRPGGYHKTPLASVFPVEMDASIDRFVRQNFEEGIDRALHLDGPLQMQPAEPAGTRHFVMRLESRGENLAAWKKLPPLTGANKFRGARDGSVVLAEDQFGRPMLVAAQPGGRVLAFAGDSTWRWVMQGRADAHRRFWRQVILWLAKKDEITKGDVWVKLDGRRFTPGQRVTFTAGANSADGEPLADVSIEAQVIEPDGNRRAVRLVRQGEDLQGTVTDFDAVGTYQIEAIARQDGAEVGSDTARFMVYSKDRELSSGTADPTLLENLAVQTRDYGGRRLTPEELPALLAEIADQPKQLEEKVTLTVTYWDRWYILFFVVGLLSTEWFLRKKWRLV